MPRMMLGYTLLVLFSTVAVSQSERGLSLDKLMKPQEINETGVNSLTPAQRRALEVWLAQYTKRVVRTVIKNPSTFEHLLGSNSRSPSSDYPNAGNVHWISEVNSEGAIVTLEDGSVWAIADADRIDTALWLPTTDITVLKVPNPTDEYRYVLVNTDDKENASAKYLGKQ